MLRLVFGCGFPVIVSAAYEILNGPSGPQLVLSNSDALLQALAYNKPDWAVHFEQIEFFDASGVAVHEPGKIAKISVIYYLYERRTRK